MDSIDSTSLSDSTDSFESRAPSTPLELFSQRHAVAISATSASVFSVLFGYPFDTLKTRMQAFKYASMTDCIKKTYSYEGVLGFYRGVFPALASVSLLRSISFSLYTQGKHDILATLDPTLSPFNRIALSSCLSGLLTGSVIALVNAPVEFIKIQKQLERLNVISMVPHHEQPQEGHSMTRSSPSTSQLHASSPHKHSISTESTSVVGWMRRIIDKKGLLGLYSGAHLHIARDGLGTSLYFAGYELMKYSLTPQGTPSTPLVHLISGGFAGTACWLVLFPIDVVKSVIQRDAMRDQVKYSTAREFIHKAWSKGGIRRFYSGIGPQLVRSFPVHALNFLVYEHVFKWCSHPQDSW